MTLCTLTASLVAVLTRGALKRLICVFQVGVRTEQLTSLGTAQVSNKLPMERCMLTLVLTVMSTGWDVFKERGECEAII